MSKQNKEVLHQMKKIYYKDNLPYIDWMGFKITEENCPTYHHIIKAKDMINSSPTVENGAYLGKKSHELLHRIEENNYDLYLAWNSLFKLINESKKYPNEFFLNIMRELNEESLEYLNIKKRVKK